MVKGEDINSQEALPLEQEQEKQRESVKREDLKGEVDEAENDNVQKEEPNVQKEEDDDDDDEEDDDDDDEEDDEDEEESARRRKKSKPTNQFLDVEAEVDEDEDEEDDDEEAEMLRNEFLADEPQGEENATNDRAHRKLDRSREKLDEQDAQALADEFKARYGRSASSRYMGSSQNVSQRLLLPSIDDPLIWGVRVRNGKEKEIVKQLYARMLNMKGSEGVYSVFQRDSFIGYVYIEARRMDSVNKILQGLPNIYNNVQKVLVPIEEYPDLLRPGRSDEVRLKPGAYVRIRSGRYKGDLGIVDNLAENDLEVRVKLVPRLDYGRNAQTDPTTGKKKQPTYNATHRPPQRLFSEIEAQQYDHEHINSSKPEKNFYIYKNDEYENGFLFKDIKLNMVETKNIKPTLHELTLFNSNNGSEGIDLQSVSSVLKSVAGESIVFQPNDRVQIISGEQSKMKGKILSIAEAKIARVLLEGNEIGEDVNGTIVEAPTTSLRKVFLAGDHVTVIHGVHIDESGLIVDVKENQVTLVSDQTRKDITVFPNYLVRSLDSSTSSSKIGRFELHQMVNLSSHKVAMITKIEKEIFTVLCSDGRVLSIEPRQILSVLKTNRITEKTIDKNGLEIKVGDVVKESTSEKRQGNIIHIYKSHLFLQSKTVYENNGIFVTDSNSVQTISNKGSIGSSYKAPDLNKMNPDRMMAPPPVAVINQAKFGGRDFSISQHVSVRKGPYKGKKGIIKDANGEVARVEMHNPAKIIPISKNDLLFEMRPGNYVPYETFMENYRGGRGGNRGPSRPQQSNRNYNYNNNGGGSNGNGGASSYGGAGNRTSSNGGASSWGSTSYGSGGGKTPSWGSTGGAGGKTPSWGSSNGGAGGGGKTPSWGATAYGGNTEGGKTPSWGTSGGGKTPSWGAPSAAGGKTPSWGDSSANSGGKTVWGDN